MDNNESSGAFEGKTRFLGRARGAAAWLKVKTQTPLAYETTSDFSMATAFDSEGALLKAWSALVASARKSLNPPKWVTQSDTSPYVAKALDPSAPPARIQLFLATSQGRFVGEEGQGISRRWLLVASLEDATVFTSEGAAKSALTRVLPARGQITGAVIPMECAAQAPLALNAQVAMDPLAMGMASASARWDLEQATPEAQASSASKRKSAL